jgi:hypothetical protein
VPTWPGFSVAATVTTDAGFWWRAHAGPAASTEVTNAAPATAAVHQSDAFARR